MSDYQPLTDFLSSVRTGEIALGFAELEQVLGRALPASARDHQAWWANTHTHSHARSWMSAGWRTARLNLPSQKVTFVRQRSRPATAEPNSAGAGATASKGVIERTLLSPA